MSKFDDFFSNMDLASREAYAKRAGTSEAYIRIHLVPCRKIPRKQMIENLARASNGRLSCSEIVKHFYSVDLCGAAA